MQLNQLDCEKDLRHVDLVGNVCTLRSPQSPPKWRSSATVGRSPGRRGTCSTKRFELRIATSMWSPATSKIESDKCKNGWSNDERVCHPPGFLGLFTIHQWATGTVYIRFYPARSAGRVLSLKCDRLFSTINMHIMSKNWSMGICGQTERPQFWSKHLHSCFFLQFWLPYQICTVTIQT